MPPDLLLTAIEFQLRGQPGRVTVRYGTNEDPSRWGYPLLGLDSLVEVSRGFPVVEAAVEHEAEGYAAVLAWIQVVRMHGLDNDERTTFVDRAPQLAGLDLPYLAFGPLPTLFDAPSTNEYRNMDWEAHATLVASPDCVMTRRVQPLCAFSWGYQLRERQPSLFPIRELGASSWRQDCAVLRDRHPSWTFEAKT